MDSDVWFAELMRARAARMRPPSADPSADVPKPGGPLSPGEVEVWLREFGFDAQKPQQE
jgi:hypothetical protein